MIEFTWQRELPSPSMDTNLDWFVAGVPLLSALAWPFALVLVVFILRKPITRLMDRAKEAEIAGYKVKLAEEVARAEVLGDVAEAVSPPDITADMATGEGEDEVASDGTVGSRLENPGWLKVRKVATAGLEFEIAKIMSDKEMKDGHKVVAIMRSLEEACSRINDVPILTFLNSSRGSSLAGAPLRKMYNSLMVAEGVARLITDGADVSNFADQVRRFFQLIAPALHIAQVEKQARAQVQTAVIP